MESNSWQSSDYSYSIYIYMYMYMYHTPRGARIINTIHNSLETVSFQANRHESYSTFWGGGMGGGVGGDREGKAVTTASTHHEEQA